MKKYKCPKCKMEYSKPGKCEMDGTKLVKMKGSHNKHKDVKGHSKKSANHNHHKMMMKDYKKRFIVSAIITVPILVLSPLVQGLLNFELSFVGDKYVLFALSSFIFFWGGKPFLKGIFTELRQKKPGMMTLIALAISVAYFYSTAVVFGLKGKYFFWELATLIDVMLLGHYIEMKSIIGASKALEKLAELMPSTAHLLKNGDVVDVKISKLKKNDVVLIKAGEKFPADGIIVKGSSYINESMLTGESKPVKKGLKAVVIGGSINGDKILEVKVSGTGEDSYLAKVINLVKQAQESKSKTEKLADVAARWLTMIAIVAGFGTFVYWFFYGPDLAFAIERLATVMVIACPHALGLAIPLVNSVSTSVSAKNGLLIKNRTAFENAKKITTIVFDKTGTLTEGKFGVSSIVLFDKKYKEKQVLQFATSLEKNSEHPIAKGIIEKAKEYKLKILKVSKFKVLKGEGVEGVVNKQKIQLISKKALEKRKLKIPKNIKIDDVATLVFIVVDKDLVGVFTLEDKIRKESFEAISELKNRGIKCFMLTGDNKKIAKNVSDKLKLNGFFAEVLPHEKQEKIKELQEKGEFVAMAGDGINDAPALALADVGIAIGSGTDVAAETADIVLVNSNPKDVVSLIIFGKATYRKMIQNLFWATGYNAVAIPLAAGVLIGYGVVISPAIGAGMMSLSTVIVAINARLLKLKK
ncbi:MAG: copper-translocating P-type ATPase [Candidatus Magasanikbacteria bacterium]|nr:copper-translocating P-type ATPase [Candidatus Magasanikbacteria bacterium]